MAETAEGAGYHRQMAEQLAVTELVLAALERGASSGRGLSRTAGPGRAVHRSLRSLERDGLVGSTQLRRARGGQRLYRLTGSGAEALAVSRLTAKSLARGRAGEAGR
jgi:DNA-binding PadR family transcriptional regulator